MKKKKFIVIFLISLLLLISISPPLLFYYTEYTLKKELRAAIKDYAITFCNKEVEVNRIEISYSWNTAFWKADSDPKINYLSGEIIEGKVEIYNSPCTEHEGFILHREKQQFIKYDDLLNPPDFGEANLFHHLHPIDAVFYYIVLGICLILIFFLIYIYIKLYQKENREKEGD